MGIVRLRKNPAPAGNPRTTQNTLSAPITRSYDRAFQRAPTLSRLSPGISIRVVGKCSARVTMRDTGEDWLSRTMRMVEAVMEQHGFEDDNGQKVEIRIKPSAKPAAKSTNEGKLSGWNKLLRRAAFLSPLS